MFREPKTSLGRLRLPGGEVPPSSLGLPAPHCPEPSATLLHMPPACGCGTVLFFKKVKKKYRKKISLEMMLPKNKVKNET